MLRIDNRLELARESDITLRVGATTHSKGEKLNHRFYSIMEPQANGFPAVLSSIRYGAEGTPRYKEVYIRTETSFPSVVPKIP